MRKPKPQIGRRLGRLSGEQDRYMVALVEILNRRKRQVPFPFSTTDVYADLFPAYFSDICKPAVLSKGLTERELGVLTRRRNIQAAFDRDHLVRIELPDTQPQQAFYLRFEQPMIVPSNPNVYLQLPVNHRYQSKICAWIEKAQQFDNRTDDIVDKLGEFFRACGSDAVARKVWPFIMDAVKAVGPCHPVGPTEIAHVDHVVSRMQRGYIETAIAEGMMLDSYVPDAWIGYGPGV